MQPEQIPQTLTEVGSATVTRRALLIAAGIGGGLALAGCDNHVAPDWPHATDAARPEASPEGAIALPPIHEGMEASKDPQLARLAVAEKALGNGFESMYLFSGIPRTVAEAESQGVDMAARLTEWAKWGVKPVVMMRPTFAKGEAADLNTLNATNYVDEHGVLDKYFAVLRQAGVTDEQMGTWALYPEPNLPIWKNGNTNPATFRANVIGAAQRLKTHFRNAKAAIMLNSTTFGDGDIQQTQGTNQIAALLPYVSDIPEGLIDAVGLQGLPWERYDSASDFLSAKAVAACAARLRVKDVTLNTGSFASRPLDKGQPDLKIVTADRAVVLADELKQAMLMRRAGLNVTMNLFAQNVPGEADWSYSTPDSIVMLRGGVQVAARAGVRVSMFV